MAVLPVVIAYQRLGFKGSLVAGVAVVAALCALYYGSDFFHTRVNAVFIEVQQWVDGQAIAQDTSNGRRLSFWLHSIEAFVQAPWFGYGMGGFESAVAPHAQAAGFTFEFNNPHNQYLLLAVQGGLLALVLYLTLHWHGVVTQSNAAPGFASRILAGLCVVEHAEFVPLRFRRRRVLCAWFGGIGVSS